MLADRSGNTALHYAAMYPQYAHTHEDSVVCHKSLELLLLHGVLARPQPCCPFQAPLKGAPLQGWMLVPSTTLGRQHGRSSWHPGALCVALLPSLTLEAVAGVLAAIVVCQAVFVSF